MGFLTTIKKAFKKSVLELALIRIWHEKWWRWRPTVLSFNSSF